MLVEIRWQIKLAIAQIVEHVLEQLPVAADEFAPFEDFRCIDYATQVFQRLGRFSVVRAADVELYHVAFIPIDTHFRPINILKSYEIRASLVITEI